MCGTINVWGGSERRNRVRLGALVLFVVLLVGASMLLVPSHATAATRCTAVERSYHVAARTHLLASEPGSTRRDVLAMMKRSRGACDDARFVFAISRASRFAPQPNMGDERWEAEIPLVAVSQGTGVVWRINTERLAKSVSGARSASKRAGLRVLLYELRFGTARPVWSDDVTRRASSVARQAAVAAALIASSDAVDQQLAHRTVRVTAAASFSVQLARTPIAERLTHVRRLLRAARNDQVATRVSKRHAYRTYAKVRAARQAHWSYVDGAWSTAREHRTLVSRASSVLALAPHTATAKIVSELRADLQNAPQVGFVRVPIGDFYPWPRDDAFDTQTGQIHVDKPLRMRLRVYDGAGVLVRTIDTGVTPGLVTFDWDGSDETGRILVEGMYRYVLELRDLAGNVRVAPGLSEFTIARDRTRPRVSMARLSYMRSSSGQRLIARWSVIEPHSPRVRTFVILRNAGRQMKLQLDESARRRGVRKDVRLARGTWRATYIFIDGSGNKTTTAINPIVVR